MHSSKRIIGSAGKEFAGKKICLCITGSVAAARCPDLARELMRHGADVQCVMSEAAQKLVGAELLHWATGNPVVTKLTGECEHVTLCGDVPGKADLVLIAPCTANTLGKIARGIDDTAVTTVASTALGSGIPLILVPAMHGSIYRNPFVSGNIARLRKEGVAVMEPAIAGGKAKIPGIQEIADECARALSKQAMKGMRVLVTAGATREFFDDVRFISNPGSGKMGIALAREAWLRGADVTLVAGNLEATVPAQIEVVNAPTAKAMLEEVKKRAAKSDFVMLAASAGDFELKRKKGKIGSGKKVSIELIPVQKVSDQVKKWNPKARLVLFKAESNVNDRELERRAREKMGKCKADLIVANDVSREGAGFGTETNEVLIIGRTGKPLRMKASKREIANRVAGLLC